MCIDHLISLSPYLTSESKLIKTALAEAIVCTKYINSKCRQCAFTLVTTIVNVLKKQDGGLQSFTSLILTGLSCPRITSCALRSLAAVLYGFHQDLTLECVQGLLETVSKLIEENNREVVAAGMSFLKVYTKVLPTEVLAGSLPLIFKTLSSMTDDCKRHSRLEIGYFLTKMIRKFGAEFVEKLIPRQDEVMMKRLRNLRKMDNRRKRIKEEQRNQEDSSSDLDVKGTSKTLDDILKDSDSEMELLEEECPRTKVKSKVKARTQAWIQDDPENIVDLADVSSARKITATDPKKIRDTADVKQKKKDGGFKTAPEGRLIIGDDLMDDDDEEPRPSGDVDSDSDDTAHAAALPPRGQTTWREDGECTGSAASVSSHVGSEYRSKKAKGDIKKKGKPEPYAYLPLSRKNLNKRTKTATSKQFKGVVKSKTKSGRIMKKLNK